MVANLDLGLEYLGGINKPTPDQIGYYARVDSTGLNLEYVAAAPGGGGSYAPGSSGNVLVSNGNVFAAGALNLASAAAVTGRTPFANLPSIATDTLMGRDAAGSGDAQAIAVGNGVEFTGGNAIRVAATLPSRGTENVAVDLLPSQTTQGTLATATTNNTDVAIATSRRYTITADVYVDDGADGVCIFAKSIVVRAHQTGGAAVIVTTSVIDDTATAGWAFTAASSTTNVRFTLNNTSGTTRTFNLLISSIVADKP